MNEHNRSKSTWTVFLRHDDIFSPTFFDSRDRIQSSHSVSRQFRENTKILASWTGNDPDPLLALRFVYPGYNTRSKARQPWNWSSLDEACSIIFQSQYGGFDLCVTRTSPPGQSTRWTVLKNWRSKAWFLLISEFWPSALEADVLILAPGGAMQGKFQITCVNFCSQL